MHAPSTPPCTACSANKTPLTVAIERNKPETAAFLRSVGGKGLSFGHNSAMHSTRLYANAAAAADDDDDGDG